MKKLALVMTLIFVTSSFANAMCDNGTVFCGTSQFTGGSVLGTMMTYSLTSGMDGWEKIVVEAKEDINYFVASQGEVRTARFEQAMAVVRSSFAVDQASDMELAQAVLAEIQ